MWGEGRPKATRDPSQRTTTSGSSNHRKLSSITCSNESARYPISPSDQRRQLKHQLWAHPARLLQRLRHPKTIRIHLRTLQNNLSSIPTASRLVAKECTQVQICCSSCLDFSCSAHRPPLSYLILLEIRLTEETNTLTTAFLLYFLLYGHLSLPRG